MTELPGLTLLKALCRAMTPRGKDVLKYISKPELAKKTVEASGSPSKPTVAIVHEWHLLM
jgi:hypothetical protein